LSHHQFRTSFKVHKKSERGIDPVIDGLFHILGETVRNGKIEQKMITRVGHHNIRQFGIFRRCGRRQKRPAKNKRNTARARNLVPLQKVEIVFISKVLWEKVWQMSWLKR
jgi:hypothetical protein